jgi:hypothetical protein
LKKINKLLQPSGIVVDKKSATEISVALHCYWEVKKKMNILYPETANESSIASAASAHNAEFTRDFTQLVQDTIVSKRVGPTSTFPKVTFQSFPSLHTFPFLPSIHHFSCFLLYSSFFFFFFWFFDTLTLCSKLFLFLLPPR